MPLKKSPRSLRTLCLLNIKNNYCDVEDQIENLHFFLINELYQRFEIEPIPTRLFLNSATHKLLVVHRFPKFDLPFNQLFKKIGQVCPNLSDLELHTSEISSKDLKILMFQIPNIQRINLIGSKCTDSVLFVMAKNCLKLKSLDLSCCKRVTDTGLLHICANDKLHITCLKISFTSVTCEGCITALKNLPYLKIFISVSLEDQIFEKLIDDSNLTFKNLKIVSCTNYLFTGSELKIASVRFPNLIDITIKLIEFLELVNFVKLKSVTVMGGNGVTVVNDLANINAFKTVGKHLAKLKLIEIINIDVSLILHSCHLLKHLIFESVTTSKVLRKTMTLKNLELFHVFTSNIKENQFLMILGNSRNLEELTFENCETLTDDVISKLIIMNQLVFLKRLRFYLCDSLTISSLMSLLKFQNLLNRLEVDFCRNVTQDDSCALKDYINNNCLDLSFMYF